ncbi:hypothetical protein SCHPADRAFT_946072 [Schizopora paradoxa]|uniref:Uncharacterized protein n=1 Tax=Schizopora paradoxa TaxID=27342 RepID=A0A0H2RNS4_9AGAM|nr:hypothetical protein SCHPADRAFT_946072 [Schizopora paradoxa]
MLEEDSGISFVDANALVRHGDDNSRDNVLQLFAIEDESSGTKVPFLSRSVAWTFCVEWFSKENPSKWVEKMKFRARECDNDKLLQTMNKISVPLLNVLVARNNDMLQGVGDKIDLRLDGSLNKVLRVPKSLSEVKTIYDKEGNNAKNWFMTHLLTILQDRLMWAVSQESTHNNISFPFPLRASEDDATIENMLHPRLELSNMSVDKKLSTWLEFCDANWLDTLKTFIDRWGKYKKTISIPKVASGEEGDSVLYRLFRSTTQSQASAVLMPILNNIQEAALCIASLRLYDGNAGRSRWHVLLQEATGIKVNVDKKKESYANYDFLRSLFAAVVLGPIVLLKGKSLSAGNHDGLTLTQLAQMSFVGSSNTSLERSVINRDLFGLLIDISLEGADHLVDRLDELVTSWTSFLKLDEPSKKLLLPLQSRDPHGPPGANALAVDARRGTESDEFQQVMMNVDIDGGVPHEHTNASRLKSREEVNYVLNQRHDTESAEEYVMLVKSALTKKISDVVVVADLPSSAPRLQEPQARADSTPPMHDEPVPRVVSRPDIRMIGRGPYVGMLSGQDVILEPPLPARVLDLPRWNSQEGAHMRRENGIELQVFSPIAEGGNVRYSDTKTVLNFRWATSKNKDIALLLHMWKSAKWSHNDSAFRERENGAVKTVSQLKWRGVSASQRAATFGNAVVHLVHDPNAPHPHPVLDGIKNWSETEFSMAFDLFAPCEAEDQSWLPTNYYPAVEGGRYDLTDWSHSMNIPRTGLHKLLSKTNQRFPIPIRPPPLSGNVARFADSSNARPHTDAEIKQDVSLRVLEEEFSDARDRQITIEQFLLNLQRTEQLAAIHPRCLPSALFIRHARLLPLPLPLEGLDLFSHLQTSINSSHTFATRIPAGLSTYAQFLSPTVMTRIQTSPNGLAKLMRLVLGHAVVFIGTPDQDCHDAFCTSTGKEEEFARKVAASSETENEEWTTEHRRSGDINGVSYRPCFSVLNGYLAEGLTWDLLVLRPGDDLIIPPGVPHCVLALEACFVVNNLFYSSACMDKTMKGLLVGHWYGHLAVADDGLAVSTSLLGSLLLRMVFQIRDSVRRAAFRSTLVQTVDLPIALDDDGIATLIYTVGYLIELDPSLGMEHHEFDDGATGAGSDGIYATRRLPRPRLAMDDDQKLLSSEGGKYIVNLNPSLRAWQFTPDFHQDYRHVLANELPELLDLLLHTSRYGIAHALKRKRHEFTKWRAHLQNSATIRERDRNIYDQKAFEKLITEFIAEAGRLEKGKRKTSGNGKSGQTASKKKQKTNA